MTAGPDPRHFLPLIKISARPRSASWLDPNNVAWTFCIIRRPSCSRTLKTGVRLGLGFAFVLVLLQSPCRSRINIPNGQVVLAEERLVRRHDHVAHTPSDELDAEADFPGLHDSAGAPRRAAPPAR